MEGNTCINFRFRICYLTKQPASQADHVLDNQHYLLLIYTFSPSIITKYYAYAFLLTQSIVSALAVPNNTYSKYNGFHTNLSFNVHDYLHTNALFPFASIVILASVAGHILTHETTNY